MSSTCRLPVLCCTAACSTQATDALSWVCLPASLACCCRTLEEKPAAEITLAFFQPLEGSLAVSLSTLISNADILALLLKGKILPSTTVLPWTWPYFPPSCYQALLVNKPVFQTFTCCLLCTPLYLQTSPWDNPLQHSSDLLENALLKWCLWISDIFKWQGRCPDEGLPFSFVFNSILPLRDNI